MTDLTTAPVASDIEDNDITMLVRVVNGVDTLYQVPASVIRGEQGPQGPQGEQGPQGIQGTKGSTWYYGSGSPPSTLTPIVNDMYFDTNNCDIYNYNSENKWIIIGNIRGLQGIQGDAGSKWYIGDGPPILSNISDYDLYMDYGTGNVYQYLNNTWNLTNLNLIGPKGDQGPQGIQGQIGSQWYYGSGSPTLTNVNKNDMYLDTNTSNIYSFNSVWTKVGNIKGLQGQIGSQWYTGAGLPVSNSSYSINDFYLNNLTSDVYHYTSTGWVKVANIQGQQGDQGIQGQQGDQGIQGSIWYYGNVSPPTIIPRNYDLYLNGLNGDVYQYISSVWVDIGNIRGVPGTLSSDGTDNIKINDATLYNSGSISFSSNGDNTTIDSVLTPSGGTAGTPYQGTLTVESNIFSVKNQFNSDQGNIKSDGNGDLSVKNLTINGIRAVTTSDIANFVPSNIGSNEQKVVNFYWSNDQGRPEVNYGSASTPSSVYLVIESDLSSYALKASSNSFTTEQHFSYDTFTDPDFGVHRDAKFGQDGIAVVGGTKTDTITITGKSSLDNGAITTDGSGNLTTSGLLNAKSPTDVPGTSTGNNVATTNWVDSNYVSLSKSTTQTVTGPVTFSSKTLVPNVDDWTSQEAIPAVQADDRYVRNNAGTQGGIVALDLDSDGSGRAAFERKDGSWGILQPAGDYATNAALNTETTNRTNADTNLKNWANSAFVKNNAGNQGGIVSADMDASGVPSFKSGTGGWYPVQLKGDYVTNSALTDAKNSCLANNNPGISGALAGTSLCVNPADGLPYLAYSGNSKIVALALDSQKLSLSGGAVSWLQVTGNLWALGNNLSVYNSAANAWCNTYVDGSGAATWDLNGGTPGANAGNKSWLRLYADGTLRTRKDAVVFQSQLPFIDQNLRVQVFSVVTSNAGFVTLPTAFSTLVAVTAQQHSSGSEGIRPIRIETNVFENTGFDVSIWSEGGNIQYTFVAYGYL